LIIDFEFEFEDINENKATNKSFERQKTVNSAHLRLEAYTFLLLAIGSALSIGFVLSLNSLFIILGLLTYWIGIPSLSRY
jgi:hypothetical protein